MIARTAPFTLTLLRMWAGKVLNAIGVPGVLQPGTYEAGIARASIRVHVGPLFTVVSVNGVDVYFHRITGAIDGVGFSTATGCTADGIPGLGRLAEQPAGAQAPTRS